MLAKNNRRLVYYILFIAGLWFFNRKFQDFVVLHGIIRGLFVGVTLAFLSRLLLSTLTKLLFFIIIIIALLVFLFSIGYLTLPSWVLPAWGIVRGFI